jgi:NDP-sugar pyrophosphorylase family protein
MQAPKPGEQLPLPFEVVVMAGGKGERMRPLTQDLPKPLLDLAGKPIAEHMIRRFNRFGVKHFTFCVNYLGDKIEAHFGDGKRFRSEISYLHEQEPLGTIGGLSLKQDFKFNDLLVINGDLLTTINFERFYTFFLDQDADMAVATIPYTVNLPYGILDLEEDRSVTAVREKPSFTYHINSGIYLMRRETCRLIPSGTRFDAVDLIDHALACGLKVASYPLLEYWIDIGQMEDYRKAQKDIQFLEL